jgi:hypothetical protein
MPELADEAPAAVLGVHDDRVHPLVQRALGGELAGPRLAGRTSWAVSTRGPPHEPRAPSSRASTGCTGSHCQCTTSARAARR